MAHPYKRDRRPATTAGVHVDTLAIDAIVTIDDRVITLSYELSLEDVPDRFHDEIVSTITMSINPNVDEPFMVMVSEELDENMGSVFMEELIVCIKAVNMDIEEFLSTQEKEEIKMNETSQTTSAAQTQPVENTTPKVEVPSAADIFAAMKTVEKRLDEHHEKIQLQQKSIDKLAADVDAIKNTKKEDNSLGIGGWTTLAAMVGGIAGVGYYIAKR